MDNTTANGYHWEIPHRCEHVVEPISENAGILCGHPAPIFIHKEGYTSHWICRMHFQEMTVGDEEFLSTTELIEARIKGIFMELAHSQIVIPNSDHEKAGIHRSLFFAQSHMLEAWRSFLDQEKGEEHG